MDATTLRELQAPLKQAYRDDPASAATPLHARGRGEGDDVTFTVAGWAGDVRAGLHEATGGDGRDACSGDMLLEALLGCAGVTLRSVATAMGIGLTSVAGEVTGSFDARGTLGVDRETPVGVTGVRVVFDVDTDADDAQLAKLAQLTERYCVVAKSLATAPDIEVRRA
ncbi:OsmC family protein [Aquipuribacter sp. SD81]|uniref:OsmC family protein n=1 Tax=Aquipuribacter sp. SD81 TaxID=3127703 RepID=UPI003016A65C